MVEDQGIWTKLGGDKDKETIWEGARWKARKGSVTDKGQTTHQSSRGTNPQQHADPEKRARMNEEVNAGKPNEGSIQRKPPPNEKKVVGPPQEYQGAQGGLRMRGKRRD